MYQGDPRQVISHLLLLQALIIIIIIIMQVSMCLMKMVRPERHVKWWALKCIIGLMNTTMENQRRFVFFGLKFPLEVIYKEVVRDCQPAQNCKKIINTPL